MAMTISPDDGEKQMKNGRKPLYPDNARIRLKVQENPGGGGTYSHECFEIARRSETFGDYREAEGNLKYLYWSRAAASWRLPRTRQRIHGELNNNPA
jgi:hypothetical protein